MDELIYNQTKIPKNQWRYGFRSSAATGCGWIATYNALRLLGYKTDPEQLIRYYERQLPLIHGNTGTSFWGPALRFHQWGFPVSLCVDPKKYDAMVEEYDVCILFYHWYGKLKLGAHFVALHKQDCGIIGYNTYTNSTGPDHYGISLEAFIKRRKYFGTVLIGIRDKRANSEGGTENVPQK